MNPQTAIELRDIHLPEAVSWWPLAWGWWVLIAITLLLCGIGLWKWLQWRKRQAPIRQALSLLTQLEQQLVSEPQKLVAEISVLLRRVAMSRFPCEEVAGLTGQAWLDFLNQTVPKPLFISEQDKRLLTEQPYQRSAPFSQAFIGNVRVWIRQHRIKKG